MSDVTRCTISSLNRSTIRDWLASNQKWYLLSQSRFPITKSDKKGFGREKLGLAYLLSQSRFLVIFLSPSKSFLNPSKKVEEPENFLNPLLPSTHDHHWISGRRPPHGRGRGPATSASRRIRVAHGRVHWSLEICMHRRVRGRGKSTGEIWAPGFYVRLT
jgi:hypothetical protein